MEEQPPVLADLPVQAQILISLGATCLGEDRCRFLVWAPKSASVEILILQPHPQRATMQKQERGYFEAALENVPPGSFYRYVLDSGKELPDPASRFQPEGVHGPSQVVSSNDFHWTDTGWKGIPLASYILYELHTGTFTPDGTFDAILLYLDGLKALGVTAIEVMPVAQFPGDRNWGYDGVYPYAVQNTYGGPEGLKKLANACHERGLAIVLDVVYNHFGPEGNYTSNFGPYVTDQYRTPWGQAINFDGSYSDEVARFFIENALYWLTEFHIDALRLDAIHSIMDRNARPFLAMLSLRVQEFRRQTGRDAYLIAESDLNDARVVRPCETSGYGMDAQWNDDLHHALHALLTDERSGYYQDFGELQDVVKALREGFVYSGDYSTYRRRRHGNSSRGVPASQFVVFGQNHDQIGNRAKAERLSRLISFEGLKLVAGVVMLSPFIPLLFMGEEYGEEAPFNFFTSHGDVSLIEAVRKGRRDEFAAFGWQSEPPDPQAEETFFSSKLRREVRSKPRHQALMDFYRELIRLRKALRPLSFLSKKTMEVRTLEREKMIFLRRWYNDEEIFAVFNFSKSKTSCVLPTSPGQWRKLFDSSEARWLGEGGESPQRIESAGSASVELCPDSFILYGNGKQSRNLGDGR